MIRVRIDAADLGPEARQYFARDIADLFAVNLIGIEKEHPVGRTWQRPQFGERAIAHIGEIDEGMARDVQRSAGRERTGLDGGDVLTACEARIIVDDQTIDGIGNRRKCGREIEFACSTDTQGAGDRGR